ncbi:uncharacterized protein V1518DRAFT_449065 [Limtongia smithiae]|uniref:uncharacterized protein n=1 Tax=Limtongia smithiae TaxID=1125753 RepID=UPI0034CD0F74
MACASAPGTATQAARARAFGCQMPRRSRPAAANAQAQRRCAEDAAAWRPHQSTCDRWGSSGGPRAQQPRPVTLQTGGRAVVGRLLALPGRRCRSAAHRRSRQRGLIRKRAQRTVPAIQETLRRTVGMRGEGKIALALRFQGGSGRNASPRCLPDAAVHRGANSTRAAETGPAASIRAADGTRVVSSAGASRHRLGGRIALPFPTGPADAAAFPAWRFYL